MAFDELSRTFHSLLAAAETLADRTSCTPITIDRDRDQMNHFGRPRFKKSYRGVGIWRQGIGLQQVNLRLHSTGSLAMLCGRSAFADQSHKRQPVARQFAALSVVSGKEAALFDD